MQIKTVTFILLVLFIGTFQLSYAKVRNVEKWGNRIIEMQVDNIQKECEKLARFRFKEERMPWIEEELQQMEGKFLTDVKRLKKIKPESPSITFELNVKTPITVSFNIGETERVSNALFSLWDSLNSLTTTLVLFKSVCHLMPPKDYNEAKYVRNQVIQYMDLEDDGRFILKNYTRSQQKQLYESLLASVNTLKFADAEGCHFSEERFFAAHLDAFSFGYCQMLSNKIQKQCGDAYQPDRYPILPCTGCSGLLSNLNIINDVIQSDGLQQDSLFEQWLSEWMYKFSIMLFHLKFYLKGNNQ